MFSDLHTSISRLSIEFCRTEEQPLELLKEPSHKRTERSGTYGETIMLFAHRGSSIHRQFSGQDCYILYYAYKGTVSLLTDPEKVSVSLKENECFLLPPGSGCCLYGTDKTELIVIQICIQKETQSMLFSFASAFFLQAVRYGRAAGQLCDAEPLSDRLLRYIEDHSDTMTLKALSDRFFYQPGYLSALVKRKFGKSFTALLSDQRMKKGGILLKNTSLSVEEIARAIGYSNVSSFYRCFRKYYHMSPREYAERYS